MVLVDVDTEATDGVSALPDAGATIIVWLLEAIGKLELIGAPGRIAACVVPSAVLMNTSLGGPMNMGLENE